MAYCCRDFVVNRRKCFYRAALLSVVTVEPAVGIVMYYFCKVQIHAGCIEQNGPIHGVGGSARFFYFTTTFWVKHCCEKIDCRCKWLVYVNSFSCTAPNRCLFAM